jgi:hypothetical protein
MGQTDQVQEIQSLTKINQWQLHVQEAKWKRNQMSAQTKKVCYCGSEVWRFVESKYRCHGVSECNNKVKIIVIVKMAAPSKLASLVCFVQSIVVTVCATYSVTEWSTFSISSVFWGSSTKRLAAVTSTNDVQLFLLLQLAQEPNKPQAEPNPLAKQNAACVLTLPNG